MSVGYQDYARLSQQGGELLFNLSGNIAVNTPFFEGYVGAWPYFSLFTDCNTSAQSVRVVMEYFDGPSFTNLVGFRYAIRTGASFAITQYGNLSPWLSVFITSTDNNPYPFLQLTGYATTGPYGIMQDQSNDVPIAWWNPTVPATTTNDLIVVRVTPGPAKLIFTSAANTYTYRHRYFDYGSNAFKTMFVIQGSISGDQWQLDAPMFDAPIELEITNTAAAAASYTVSYISEST